jgi:hypothetical protein
VRRDTAHEPTPVTPAWLLPLCHNWPFARKNKGGVTRKVCNREGRDLAAFDRRPASCTCAKGQYPLSFSCRATVLNIQVIGYGVGPQNKKNTYKPAHLDLHCARAGRAPHTRMFFLQRQHACVWGGQVTEKCCITNVASERTALLRYGYACVP